MSGGARDRSKPGRPTAPRRRELARAFVVRALIFAALWWVLSEGSPRGWLLSGLSVGGAAVASLALTPPPAWRWRVRGLLGFLPFFAWQSMRGGIDVALRAMRPGPPIEPDQLLFPLRLPPGPSRVFFAATLSLLPGSVSTRLDGDSVRVHVLDRRLPVRATLRRLETHVAALFGEEIEPVDATGG